ncbi:MAG: sensor histidine kinase [Verrucomicrobia bacterium]|nr:sensor histidine kinase [Verrucomicrobiota bacterium]
METAEKSDGRQERAGSNGSPGPVAPPRRGGRRAARALALTAPVLVFGLAVGLLSWNLRERLREQIARRDATVLHELALLQALSAEEESPAPGELGLPPDEALTELTLLERADRLQNAVQRLRGLYGARLYDAKGKPLATIPVFLAEKPLAPAQREALETGRPAARFLKRVKALDLYLTPGDAGLAADAALPILEVTLPLSGLSKKKPAGAAVLLLDGRPLVREFRLLDRRVLRQALAVWVAGSAMIVGVLAWAFGRMERTTRLLEARSRELLRANAELTLAAKSSAIGALAGHLIHDLKNPLAGLRHLIEERLGRADGAETELWRQALAEADRMQGVLQEVAQVLREEIEAVQYELAESELAELIRERLSPAAEKAGVRAQVVAKGKAAFTNREANLLLLILDHLGRNAIEATPPGGEVLVRLFPEGNRYAIEVQDQGPGLPESVRARLFQPIRSKKPGGSGLGLAIARQLAGGLGGELRLVRSGPEGTLFRLSLPARD